MAMTSSASFFIASPKQWVYAWTSGSTSLLGDPVGYVRRAVEDTDASDLTGPEEANNLYVDESHFFQIQRDLRSTLLGDPVGYVRRAVEDTDASDLTGPEEANNLYVDESHFFQIQRDLRSTLL